MAALNQLAPAFDVLPFAEALKRECAALRDSEGGLIMAFADPFQARSPGLGRSAGAGAGDLVPGDTRPGGVPLARHEDSMRAMEAAGPPPRTAASPPRVSRTFLSKTITEDTSPVVRLDAFNAVRRPQVERSDIHLESGADALLIKYRIDGVLSQ
jgi:general secretion pathway protein E